MGCILEQSLSGKNQPLEGGEGGGPYAYCKPFPVTVQKIGDRVPGECISKLFERRCQVNINYQLRLEDDFGFSDVFHDRLDRGKRLVAPLPFLWIVGKSFGKEKPKSW